MDNNNYLNLAATDLDKPVYRIISLDRFRQLMEQRQNTLVSPRCWDDPFENFILKCPVQLVTGEIATVDFHDRYFGQCWTLQQASDAMWRIYSPNKDGIRMRTTIRRLAHSLSDHAGKWSAISAFIGRVQYLKERELEAFARKTFESIGPAHFARTLLVKRRAFAHEREIRLIFHKPDATESAKTLYSYPIEPNALIDQVMCDPRQTIEQYRAVRADIKALGFRGAIKRSLLYAPPPKFILKFSA